MVIAFPSMDHTGLFLKRGTHKFLKKLKIEYVDILFLSWFNKPPSRRMMDKVDLEATYMNALTSGVLRSARMPMALENDRAALEVALDRLPDPQRARVARIVNTLALGTFWVTETVLPELREKDTIAVDETPVQFEFDGEGRLLPFDA